MLEARSVAVVGASARPATVGHDALRQLIDGGFDGAIHPVNPRYERIAGVACAPSLADLDRPVDLVVLAVGNDRLEDQLTRAADAGAGAAIVFASAHGRAAGSHALAQRIARIAGAAGMPLCGANSMGLVHLERRLRACGYPQPPDLEPGPVTLLSHSGSLFTSLLHNRRRVRFNLAVSTGQELVTTMADYLWYAVRRPTTRVVALFCETLRDPDRFVAGLAEAQRRDIAVVALTVGRHAASQALVAAHSGALADDDGVYEALFDAHGAHRVRTLDELLDTVALFAAGRPAAAGGLAVMHDSGGERAHLLDLALDQRMPLATLSERTTATLAGALDAGLPPANPLDAWGSSRGYHETFMTCGTALLDDPDTAALVFCVDLPDLDDDEYPRIARALHAATDKPVVVLANVSGAVNEAVADDLRAAGVPVLEGTSTGLAALAHLLSHRVDRARPPVVPPPGAAADVRARWRRRLTDGRPWSEADALALLSDYGVPVVAHRLVTSEEEAVVAAADIGLPVVMKTAADGVAHKSDRGGVHLELRDHAGVRSAYRALRDAFGPPAVVAAMAHGDVELALGITVDHALGPLLVVGAGGLLVELLADRRVALPPVDGAFAGRLLDGLTLSTVLDGVRGRAPVDRGAVCSAVTRLSALATDLGDLLSAVDVNPLLCGVDGCVAVDALVIPAGAAS